MSQNELVWIALGSVATAISSAVAAASLIVAARGLSYTGKQVEESRKIARGEFLLRLDELFQQHIQVHMRLRPGGDWSDGLSGPKTPDEWGQVERYMGLFERIQVLVADGIVDLGTIDNLYGYRVFNLVSNPIIHSVKLEREAASWKDFINL